VLLFAGTGLLLSVIGLYGVISFIATQRTQEVGVRMALGANRLNILRLITWEGGRLILLGGALGLGAALVVSRLLKSLLFNVGPNDPMSFVAVALLLALVSLAATLLPARSAMKTEPLEALRHE
jgi:putative ABC transport system permease protein